MLQLIEGQIRLFKLPGYEVFVTSCPDSLRAIGNWTTGFSLHTPAATICWICFLGRCVSS